MRDSTPKYLPQHRFGKHILTQFLTKNDTKSSTHMGETGWNTPTGHNCFCVSGGHSDCKFSAFAPLFVLPKDDVFTSSPRNLWARVGSTAEPRRCDSKRFKRRLVRLKISKNYVFFQANVFLQTSPSDLSLETTLCKMTTKSKIINGETGWSTPAGQILPEALRSLSEPLGGPEC